MNLRPLLLLALLSLPNAARAQSQEFDPGVYATWNLPQWVGAPATRAQLWEEYDPFIRLNPFFQQGDFDGDGRFDIAIQVVSKTNHKRGIAIIHRATGAVYILGAGNGLGNGGDDFSWLWVWRVEPRDAITDPALRGRNLLFVEAPESAGGMIWWNGTTYVWTQWGD